MSAVANTLEISLVFNCFWKLLVSSLYFLYQPNQTKVVFERKSQSLFIVLSFCHLLKQFNTSWRGGQGVYSAAQIYPNCAYAYYTRVFCVYAYVNTRTYARIYARICPFVMHSHKFLHMKHCWSNKTYFIFMGMENASKRNLHIGKTSCRWMKAIIFRTFNHFVNSPANYRFFDTCLILSYGKWEENWNSRFKSLF